MNHLIGHRHIWGKVMSSIGGTLFACKWWGCDEKYVEPRW